MRDVWRSDGKRHSGARPDHPSTRVSASAPFPHTHTHTAGSAHMQLSHGRGPRLTALAIMGGRIRWYSGDGGRLSPRRCLALASTQRPCSLARDRRTQRNATVCRAPACAARAPWGGAKGGGRAHGGRPAKHGAPGAPERRTPKAVPSTKGAAKPLQRAPEGRAPGAPPTPPPRRRPRPAPQEMGSGTQGLR